MGKPSVNNLKNPFDDVTKDKGYYNAVLWAYKNIIIAGTSKTTFSPSGILTRGQIAMTLY